MRKYKLGLDYKGQIIHDSFIEALNLEDAKAKFGDHMYRNNPKWNKETKMYGKYPVVQIK